MKINFLRIGCIVVLTVLIASCQPHYTRNKTILKAEELLYTKPDSAFLLLESMKQPETLPKADYAAWCLHYTHARYKLQKEIKSDSLIQIALKYYSDSNLPKYSGTAWYLLGCINRVDNKNAPAIAALKKADDILKNTGENRLKGQIAFNIGYICMQDELYNHALKYFRDALAHFTMCNDTKYQAYAYREISNMYYQLNYPLDSTIRYLNIAMKLSEQTGDSINYYDILISQGRLLLKNKDAYLAKEYILKAYGYFPTYKRFYAAYLASAYAKLGQQDSAKHYLNISLADTTNSPYRIMGLHAAASIAKSENDYKKAYDYLEKSDMLRDSTYEQNMRSRLYRIDKQYDLSLEEEENARLKISNRNMVIWITLLVIAGLLAMIIFLLIRNKYKRRHAINEMEKTRFRYEAETTQIKNAQKREVLELKLQNKIGNTLQFNKIQKGYLQQEKMEAFIQEVAKQSIIAENEWTYYVDEVDELFENRIKNLKASHKDLTMVDLIVIALICLKVSITDACNLLNMTKNTMYTRRKTIKIRLEIPDNVNLETWITDFMSHRE